MSQEIFKQKKVTAHRNIAIQYAKKFHPDASLILFGGSSLNGSGTPNDIDLIILYENVAQGKKECREFNNIFFDTHIHDDETLNFEISNQFKLNRPSLATFILSSERLLGNENAYKKIVEFSNKLMQERSPSAYKISDVCNAIIKNAISLTTAETMLERIHCSNLLFESLVLLQQTITGDWNHSPKYFVRSQINSECVLLQSFDQVMSDFFSEGSSENRAVIIQDFISNLKIESSVTTVLLHAERRLKKNN